MRFPVTACARSLSPYRFLLCARAVRQNPSNVHFIHVFNLFDAIAPSPACTAHVAALGCHPCPPLRQLITEPPPSSPPPHCRTQLLLLDMSSYRSDTEARAATDAAEPASEQSTADSSGDSGMALPESAAKQHKLEAASQLTEESSYLIHVPSSSQLMHSTASETSDSVADLEVPPSPYPLHSSDLSQTHAQRFCWELHNPVKPPGVNITQSCR